jgi:hypothetical protein
MRTVPDGWKNFIQISNELGVDVLNIERRIKHFREENPDSEPAHLIKRPNGATWEYFSPDIVDAIKNEIESLEIAPEGWMKANELARNIGIVDETQAQRDFLFIFKITDISQARSVVVLN